MGKALIVVDMQNDFLTGTLSLNDCPAKQNGVQIVPTINKLITGQEWDLVVYTFDWHPNLHISFVTNAHKYPKHAESLKKEKFEVYDKVLFEIEGSKREQVLWPPHCIQESWGAQLHKDLTVAKNECRVYKGQTKTVDSYSAFYDNDKINETNLRRILLDNNIDTTYICGVATDVCVSFTAVDSHEIGFKTHVIIDACAGVSHEGIRESIDKWKNMGISVITTDSIEMEPATKNESSKSDRKTDEKGQQVPLRRSKRIRRPPNRYSDTWGQTTA